MVAFMLFKHHCLNIKSLTSTEQELYSQSYQDETTFYEMSCCPSHTRYMLSVGFLITVIKHLRLCQYGIFEHFNLFTFTSATSDIFQD